MKINKTVKYSAGFLGLLVVVLLAIPFFVDVNDFKPMIAKPIEEATGRKLYIGDIKASLFPWVGVRLNDVRLSNRQGFTDRDFLRVERLDVQVALIPLLSQRYEIKEFSLSRPELFLERNAEGVGNWEDLTGEESAAAEGPAEEGEAGKAETGGAPASSPLAALKAESLQLNDGRFIWVDAMAGSRLEFSDLQVHVDDLQLERPVAVHASAQLGADTIALEGRVGPLGDLSRLDVSKLPAQMELTSDGMALKPFAAWLPALPDWLGTMDAAKLQADLRLEQRPDGVRVSTGGVTLLAAREVRLNWRAEMPSARKVRLREASVALAGKKLLTTQGEMDFGHSLHYQLGLTSSEIERSWLADLIPGVKAMYAAHPAPWRTFRFGAMVAGTDERIDLRDIQLHLNDELVQISGVAGLGGAPDVRLRVAARELHADPWLPQPKQQNGKPSQKPAADAAPSQESAEPDLRFMKAWRVSSEMQVQKLHLRGLQLGDLRANLTSSRGVFRLDPLRFDLAGGQVSEQATLNVNPYPARWTESLHATNVQLEPVLKSLAGMDMISGTMQLDTKLEATGLLPGPAIRSLNGQGQVMLRDGKIKGFDIAGTMRTLAAPGQAGGTKSTDFAQLSGSFTVRNGIAKNNDLFMASPMFRLTGQGTVDLPAGTLDYHVKPRLVGTMVGQGDTLAVRKGLSVPLHIRGPFASLKVTPEVDPASLIKGIGGGASPKDVLRGVLGGGQQPAGEPAPAEPQQQQPAPPTPEERLQKKLEGLIKKL